MTRFKFQFFRKNAFSLEGKKCSTHIPLSTRSLRLEIDRHSVLLPIKISTKQEIKAELFAWTSRTVCPDLANFDGFI